MISQAETVSIELCEFIRLQLGRWMSSGCLPSILSTIAARRHSIFGHIRRLPDRTPAHMTLKLAVNTRSGDTPHYGWNRPDGRPRTTWMSQIVRDSGLSADDAWAVAEDRSTRMAEDATTHIRLRAAVSE